jgi:Skp family chaperone for outer membrane proteins
MGRFRLILAAIMAAGALAGMAAPALAQPAAPSTRPAPPPQTPPQTITGAPQQSLVVGIIDIGAVLRGSSAAQGLQQQMQLEQDKYQAAFDQEQRELRVAEEEIERERATLTAEAYAEKRRVFQQRLDKAANDFRLRRRQLEEGFTRANASITQTLSAAVEELASQNGVTIILRREAVLFQKDAIDITDAAIALLNRKLPSVVIALPPASQ